MLKTHAYFDDQVLSIAYQGAILPTTVGVMSTGRYTFNTAQHETMTIIDGEVRVKLPHQSDFQVIQSGQEFKVPADSQFEIEVMRPTAYLCTYG